MTDRPITVALQSSVDPMAAPNWLPWRVGRKLGRTVYAQLGKQPSDRDQLIGMMDTRELAEEVVRSHNAVLQQVQVTSMSTALLARQRQVGLEWIENAIPFDDGRRIAGHCHHRTWTRHDDGTVSCPNCKASWASNVQPRPVHVMAKLP